MVTIARPQSSTDADSVGAFSCHVDTGIVASILEVHGPYIFKVKVCKVKEFLCV
jgi:hypothetical protein